MKEHDTSPLDNITPITVAGLRLNRTAKNMIEGLINRGDCPEEMREEYNDAKKASFMAKAVVLYGEGKTLKASELGHPKAMGEMANKYLSAKNGYKKELGKGFEFATKAANENDANGQFLLGGCYLKGWGRSKEINFAFEWFLRCEDAIPGYALLIMVISILWRKWCQEYFLGVEVEQSYVEARKLLKKSADQGFAGAEYMLGKMIVKKLGAEGGVVDSSLKGLEWSRKAADQGNVDAQAYLAASMVKLSELEFKSDASFI